MRGRLAGMEMISYTSGPTLGNVEAGFAAALIGLRGSIVAGGVLCVGGSVALAAALPGLWRYESRGACERQLLLGSRPSRDAMRRVAPLGRASL